MTTKSGTDRTQEEGIAAPYVSWTTVKNTIEKMAREGGVPSQVDRSYLSNVPGSTQTHLIASMRWLGLIEANGKPTELLEGLVEQNEDDRKNTIAAIIKEKYPSAIALPALATQGQLEGTFREMGLSGSTMRKAVAFFLAAAKFGDISLSPHFKTPRQQTGNGGSRTTKPRKQSPSAIPASPTATTWTAPRHHPLIEGLIQELPPPGAMFPRTKQKDWIELAQVAFRIIYKTDAEGEREPEPEPDLFGPEPGGEDQ